MAIRYCKDCHISECGIKNNPLGRCDDTSLEEAQRVLLLETELDWEKFRREAAKDILCAVLAGGIANGAKGFDAQKEELVNVSIGVADELIKQLREEKK